MTIALSDSIEEQATDGCSMFPTTRILQVVKDAQQRHGLRHADYERYRKYCSSKLTRQRKVLKFTNIHKCVRRHKAKFVKKWVSQETFTHEGFLHLCIFESERSWAQAMADKMAIEDNLEKGRKKFSMRMNLKRSVAHAKHLEELVRGSSRCDATTKLEAQAYAAWLLGVSSFELKQWREASEALKTARTVYEGLAEATHNTTLVNIYKLKCREIQPQLRLCEFNSAETPSAANMSELMALRLQIGGTDSVDKLIAEVRSKAASHEVVVIEWAGEKTTIDDDKFGQVVQGWRQIHTDINSCETPKEKMALYEKQLGDTRDAIEKISDLIKRKTSENADTSILNNIKSYFEFLKISGTIARYLSIIENTQADKKHKPQDLLRLYDSIIELCKECVDLPGAAIDKLLITAYTAKVEYYKAFRCFYMACSYVALGRYSEAIALFERAEIRRSSIKNYMSDLVSNHYFDESNEMKLYDDLGKRIEIERVSSRMKRLLESSGAGNAEDGNVQKSLIHCIDEWNKWQVGKSKETVTDLPPAFIPMPNKPLFFDLALNHVKMPDLQDRLVKCADSVKSSSSKKATSETDKESSISGMMKGWIWGKK